MTNTFLGFTRKHHCAPVLTIIALAVIALAGCQQSNPQAAVPETHPLTGVVVSVDKAKELITVEHDEVPGEMEAMVMPFSPADPADLSRLHEGDVISADYSIQANGAVLENIKIVGTKDTAKSAE